MPLPSNLSFFGAGKESTKGTGVVPADFVPLSQFDPQDTPIWLDDTAMRGAMVDIFNVVQGPIFSGIDLAGPVFADTFGYPLANLLGDVVTTGASAPFSHVTAIKNSTDGQGPATSWTDFYGLSGGTPARRYAGQQMSDLSVKFSADGMLEWTGKSAGFASTLVAKPTQSFTAIPPLPAWVGTVTIGGSSKLFMQQGQIDMKRPVSVIHTVDGTAAPYGIWQGPLSVTGKMTFVHEDDTELTRMIAATQPALVFDWTTGAGASLVEVKAQLSKVQYKVGAIKRGNDYATLDVDFTAIGNATDVGASAGFGLIKWTLQNAKPSGTYA